MTVQVCCPLDIKLSVQMAGRVIHSALERSTCKTVSKLLTFQQIHNTQKLPRYLYLRLRVIYSEEGVAVHKELRGIC